MRTFRFVLCSLLFPLAAHAVSASTRQPNVIIILTDDLGYGDVGVYGAKGYTTPHIDSLARDGVMFTQFHVSQGVCSASRAALLTGCYSNRLGIHGALGPTARYGLNSSETTIAEMMKSRGYVTGMAGKWHLGHLEPFLPNQHGFDESFGLPYSNDMWPYHPEAKPGTYPPLPLLENGKVIDAEVTPADQTQLTRHYTARAVSFIERNKDKPFFFYLAHSMPHVPLFVSDAFKGKSQAGLFGDVLMEIDWSVGEVLRTLKKHGLDKDTLVIFTSDNGPWLSYGNHAGSAGPLREGKGTSWEGGVRVPCLMRWPGQLPAGTTNSSFFMSIDLLPTLTARIGATLPALKIDGEDVWPVMVGSKGAKNPHTGYAFWYAQNELQSVVSGDGRWKLILPHRYRTLAGRPGGLDGLPVKYSQADVATPELYDVTLQSPELENVADEHGDVVGRLLAFAESCREELGDSLTKRVGKGAREAGKLAVSEHVPVVK